MSLFVEEKDLPTPYQQYIHLSRYSRWHDAKKQRETWTETVRRWCQFFHGKFSDELGDEVFEEIYHHILNVEVLPSMRSLWTAGKALEKDNAAAFNCSYIAIDHPRAFAEIFYLLLVGCGVGFSVERQEIVKLPVIPDELFETDTTIVVKDSKLGWVQGLNELISLLYTGRIPQWDLSNVRPAGSPLKTFGGRASGPEPLNILFKNVVAVFKKAAGRRLNSIECHDISTATAGAVLCGGVRRSAQISLSNLSDDRMRAAKTGQWWVENPNFSFANNSVAYTEKPDMGIFMKEWISLYESKAGERGIFNRQGVKKHIKKLPDRNSNFEFGVNPCGEILLRNRQLCNLSEVVIRETDTFADIKRKIRVATILGTIQSTCTNFRFLSKDWKRNCEEERLLGVSLTGIMDHPFFSGKQATIKVEQQGTTVELSLPEALQEMREYSYQVNLEFAEKLGINPSTSWTTVKPSGTVSQLCNSSSGIHPRYSPYYIRRVRGDKYDPLVKLMMDLGVDCEPDRSKPELTYVFSFPQKSPDHSIYRDEYNALKQLELYLIYKNNYTTHNPSITVYVKEHEWMAVGAWVYEHFDDVIGLTFLPHSDHNYAQAPYEEITKEQYESLMATFPKEFDWSLLTVYEKRDTTVGSNEIACTGGSCDIF